MNAISVRLEKLENSKIKHQRKHDFREYTPKTMPKYINKSRTHLNTILIKEKSEEEILKILEQAQKYRKRKIRANTAMLFSGIITFGTEAQEIVNKLPLQEQNKLFYNVIQAIAKFLNTSIESAVIHRDETAIHAHFCLFNLTNDGKTLTTKLKPDVLSKIQDIAYQVVKGYGIGRGKKKQERLANNDYNVIHKSVKQLHYELKLEIEKKTNELNKMNLQVNQMNSLLNSLQKQIKEYENTKQTKEKELKDLETRINELKPVMNTLQSDKQKLLQDIEKLKEEEQKYTEKVKKLKQQREEALKHMENLQKAYKEKYTEYQRLKEMIKQIDIENIKMERDSFKRWLDMHGDYVDDTIHYLYHTDPKAFEILLKKYDWLKYYTKDIIQQEEKEKEQEKQEQSKPKNKNINTMNR